MVVSPSFDPIPWLYFGGYVAGLALLGYAVFDRYGATFAKWLNVRRSNVYFAGAVQGICGVLVAVFTEFADFRQALETGIWHWGWMLLILASAWPVVLIQLVYARRSETLISENADLQRRHEMAVTERDTAKEYQVDYLESARLIAAIEQRKREVIKGMMDDMVGERVTKDFLRRLFDSSAAYQSVVEHVFVAISRGRPSKSSGGSIRVALFRSDGNVLSLKACYDGISKSFVEYNNDVATQRYSLTRRGMTDRNFAVHVYNVGRPVIYEDAAAAAADTTCDFTYYTEQQRDRIRCIAGVRIESGRHDGERYCLVVDSDKKRLFRNQSQDMQYFDHLRNVLQPRIQLEETLADLAERAVD